MIQKNKHVLKSKNGEELLQKYEYTLKSLVGLKIQLGGAGMLQK